ncbi:MAG: gamma-glutamyltransferase family protein, partial [Gemmatimonadales bacterium]|nr:gamma-glutamyltransferase family protein [Gemmatimonadales bacterium]
MKAPAWRMITVFAMSLLLLPLQATAWQAGGDRSPDRPAHRPAVPGPNGLVTAGHPLASMAGLRMLMAGGNAADAAVATLATLNVVRPQMSGMAGNGFVTLYDAVSDRVYSLGATGAAPLAIDPASRTADELNKGIHAGVVPGLFGGWIALLDRFGTMSLAQVLAPAIDYAENGHPIEASVVAAIESHRELFESFPSSRRMFLPRGRVPEPGETFRMPDLANTLRKVVEAEQEALAAGKTRSEALQAAFDRFYRGDIAEEMAQFYAENGGDFTTEDFARYEPIWAEPIHTTYRGYDIYTSPPTSRGGLEVAMQLNLVEGFDLGALGAGS